MKQQFLEFYQRMVDSLTLRYNEASTSLEAEALMKEINTYQKEVTAITKSLAENKNFA